jgi:hypothetical protein
MRQMKLPSIVFVATAFAFLLACDLRADGETTFSSSARLVTIDAYLIADEKAEAALARSAAPPAISRGATVAVLTRRGYETVSKGTNGFTCIVERAWMSPFDSAEFWNPRIRGPICYNAPASRSVLLYTFKRTQLALAGLSKSQMMGRIATLVAEKRLPVPEPGSMSYMMSKSQYLGDSVTHWYPHLMFHAPKSDGAEGGASWGADLPGSPVMLDTSHRQVPEPQSIFMVPVGRWSDGTAAPMAGM